MNTGTCDPRYRDFDRMIQHQQLTFVFLYIGVLSFTGCFIY